MMDTKVEYFENSMETGATWRTKERVTPLRVVMISAW